MGIDGAGADGSADCVGGFEPDPSTDHGGNGALIYQVVLPTVPRLSARDKNAVCQRIVNKSAGFPSVPNPKIGCAHFLWCTRRRL